MYFNILPLDLAFALFHFRTLNHKLSIEQGRFRGVERDYRIYELCFLNKLGDEYHYISDVHTLIVKGDNIYQEICHQTIIHLNLINS